MKFIIKFCLIIYLFHHTFCKNNNKNSNSEMKSFNLKNEIIEWLLTGDSSIRWQVMKDLIDYDEKL